MTGSAFDIELDDLTLARARRGDAAACERIYRSFSSPAYTIAFRVCHCPQMAQDITQDAFINAFKRLRQFRGDSPFWGWLRRVVVNHAISAMRRQPSQPTVELEEFHACTPGDATRIELSMDLESALGRLNPDDRTVVWLHDVEGYGHAEIADVFGMSESFSKTRLSRARARLRELMMPAAERVSPGSKPVVTPVPSVSANKELPSGCRIESGMTSDGLSRPATPATRTESSSTRTESPSKRTESSSSRPPSRYPSKPDEATQKSLADASPEPAGRDSRQSETDEPTETHGSGQHERASRPRSVLAPLSAFTVVS